MTSREKLGELYAITFGSAPAAVTPLAGAGSARSYFRITPPGNHLPAVVGTAGTNQAENVAFITLARHFATKALPTPHVLAESADSMLYLQEDLGDLSLFEAIKEGRTTGNFSTQEIHLLEKSIKMMARVQHFGADGIDWRVCFPQEAMDSRMIRWDLDYFKYCFLKASGADFSEAKLDEEFSRLHDMLTARASAAREFMVRDFQSRNIMVCNGEPFLIDFQGGRRGPVEYDVASFLWQAKASIPEELRCHLINIYVDEARKTDPNFDEPAFRESLPRMVLFRMLQTLGAYGLRGITEQKPHFLASIPAALHNIRRHLQSTGLVKEFPYLNQIVNDASATHIARDMTMLTQVPPFNGLTVTVCSFSYKTGVPPDLSGNGGGFVFDCRAIHNPGRYEPYKQLTGRDDAVKTFLEEDGEIFSFLHNAWELTDASVSCYLNRGFNSLCISFGCTGGQHRSVYSAEATARHMSQTFPQTRVVLWHREQDSLEIIEPSALPQ